MNKPTIKEYNAPVGDQIISFETGKLASQAGGSVTVRIGDSVMFCAATMSEDVRAGTDFLPLTVDYEEKMYAGGKIPGSFFRREGRPGSDAILVARVTDRSIRPLFPSHMRNSLQVILYSFSADSDNPLDILGINAASAALMISNIPWEGPIAAVRVARIDGKFIVNPTFSQMDVSDLDLRVAGSKEAILMVECSATEVPEDVVVEAIAFAHESLQPLIEVQLQMAEEIGKEKVIIADPETNDALFEQIRGKVSDDILTALRAPHTKAEYSKTMKELKNNLIEELTADAEDADVLTKQISEALHDIEKEIIRNRIIEEGLRPDGRTSTDIRPIWCEVNYSPRAHGSGIFTRGETQAVTFATLGTPREAQEIDTLSPNNSKRYMHHYNFPGFCTGEVKPQRSSSRREIGHGNLAERALAPVIPTEEEFPYTIRLVSEILSSNGSSSMASVCGSTLALMDCGVPIKEPISGIAMGLVKEGDKYVILTDIQGMEDHLGDMDFKVTGSKNGITALQMDIKIKGLSSTLLSEALAQARDARIKILEYMLEVIPVPNTTLKSHAPRISVMKVAVEKIGAIIGPGGKMIRALQEETKTRIDIGDDGTVFIAATDGDSEKLAREKIAALIETAEVGRIYTGKVVRVADFGAFVEILPGTDGMVHISQLDSERVNKVEDIAALGDELTVMVTAIDDNGKIRLSRQAVLEGWTAEEALSHDKRKPSGSRGGSGGSYNRDRSGGDRNRSGGGGYRGNSDRNKFKKD
ncbi:MAG: polyribonucleotide nucleotidyltransferase [Anaerolineaceae bacterium]|nr:polyribonucleotide nucleotidyltransferase [Anaerolineaceae bacterium]